MLSENEESKMNKTKFLSSLYPLADRPSSQESRSFNLPKAGGLFVTKDLRVKPTGEIRRPQYGEWFLSGAIIEGYRAKIDHLSTPYYIAKLVLTKTETKVTIREVSA